jgi:hypothetical protein
MTACLQYGVIMTEDDHEWIEGTGQKIVLACGQFSWGAWSERRQTYTYPKVRCRYSYNCSPLADADGFLLAAHCGELDNEHCWGGRNVLLRAMADAGKLRGKLPQHDVPV